SRSSAPPETARRPCARRSTLAPTPLSSRATGLAFCLLLGTLRPRPLCCTRSPSHECRTDSPHERRAPLRALLPPGPRLLPRASLVAGGGRGCRPAHLPERLPQPEQGHRAPLRGRVGVRNRRERLPRAAPVVVAAQPRRGRLRRRPRRRADAGAGEL